MQMVLTGDPIDATTAYGYGLVQRIVPRERLYAEAEDLARTVLAHPAEAVRRAKRAVVEGIEMPPGAGAGAGAATGGDGWELRVRGIVGGEVRGTTWKSGGADG